MNLQKQLNTKKSFVAITAILILIIGLFVATFMPEITAWRIAIADELVAKANATSGDSKKYSYLSQANLIGLGDPVASNELAEFWIDRGEYQKAIDVYAENIKDPNYTALGILSLKGRDYEQAKQYFEIANKQNPTAESNAGEAIALYNLDKITEGCDKANAAIKLNLTSQLANRAVESCIILGGTQSDSVRATDISTLSERALAYKLIDSYVYNQGEKRMNAIAEKTALDYLVLSKLLASQGNIDEAIVMVEQGIGIDRSIADIYLHAIRLYKIKGDSGKIQDYQNRLDQLKFEKYQ